MIYYIIFDPWAENVQESSLRKLAVVLGPYNLSKKSYGNYSPGVEEQKLCWLLDYDPKKANTMRTIERWKGSSHLYFLRKHVHNIAKLMSARDNTIHKIYIFVSIG